MKILAALCLLFAVVGIGHVVNERQAQAHESVTKAAVVPAGSVTIDKAELKKLTACHAKMTEAMALVDRYISVHLTESTDGLEGKELTLRVMDTLTKKKWARAMKECATE